MKDYLWEVEMFKNVGTVEAVVMKWVLQKRFYQIEKKITDFDLHDIPDKRKNAKFIGEVEKSSLK